MKEPDFLGKKSIFPHMAKMGPNWPKIRVFQSFWKILSLLFGGSNVK